MISTINRLILHEILSEDYEISKAEDGKEAVGLLPGSALPCQAVLLDIRLRADPA